MTADTHSAADAPITNMTNARGVELVRRGTEHDWIVVSDPAIVANGPAPTPTKVWTDHNDSYTVTDSERTSEGLYEFVEERE